MIDCKNPPAPVIKFPAPTVPGMTSDQTLKGSRVYVLKLLSKLIAASSSSFKSRNPIV